MHGEGEHGAVKCRVTATSSSYSQPKQLVSVRFGWAVTLETPKVTVWLPKVPTTHNTVTTVTAAAAIGPRGRSRRTADAPCQ